MSIYYSKYQLNTFFGTPYFKAQIPEDYPIELVCLKARAFKNLPPNIQKLSKLAKKWQFGKYVPEDYSKYYDESGHELNLQTGKPLTDEEIETSWGSYVPTDNTKVKDILLPKGGFADPNTWEPESTEPEKNDYEGPSEKTLLGNIKDRGAEYTLKYYGLPKSWASKDEKTLAHDMFEVMNGDKPAPTDEEDEESPTIAQDRS